MSLVKACGFRQPIVSRGRSARSRACEASSRRHRTSLCWWSPSRTCRNRGRPAHRGGIRPVVSPLSTSRPARSPCSRKGIVGGQCDEQGWRVGGHREGCERAIDVADECGLGILPRERRRHGEHGAGGEADHADAIGIDPPFLRALADQYEGGAGVGDLRRQPRDRRPRFGPWRPRGAREHLAHRSFECRHVLRRLVEPVFEHERGHAPVGERPGDIPALIRHRQRPEAAARCDDDRRARCPGRIGQERRERGDGDVACEDAAILAVPGLGSGRARQWPGPELDRVRLRRCRDRGHAVVLGMGCRREPPRGGNQRQQPDPGPAHRTCIAHPDPLHCQSSDRKLRWPLSAAAEPTRPRRSGPPASSCRRDCTGGARR